MNKTKLTWTIFYWLFILMCIMLMYNIFFLGKIPRRWRNNPAKLEIDGFTGCKNGFCS
jgi:hypothetical protein